jgi:ATP-dependent 26S proteasome regulatory subunit
MPSGLQIDESVNLEELARQYELSGASILNAIQFAALQAYTRSDKFIFQKDLIDGIRKEYLKEDKSF